LWRIKDRILEALSTCTLAEISSEPPIDPGVRPLTLRARV
jgi:hypothetical protein